MRFGGLRAKDIFALLEVQAKRKTCRAELNAGLDTAAAKSPALPTRAGYASLHASFLTIEESAVDRVRARILQGSKHRHYGLGPASPGGRSQIAGTRRRNLRPTRRAWFSAHPRPGRRLRGYFDARAPWLTVGRCLPPALETSLIRGQLRPFRQLVLPACRGPLIRNRASQGVTLRLEK